MTTMVEIPTALMFLPQRRSRRHALTGDEPLTKGGVRTAEEVPKQRLEVHTNRPMTQGLSR